MQSKHLETVPEDWTRALAVVAHPDDMEYGSAAAVSRWTSQGKEVHYVLATSGEAGIASLHPDAVGPAREEEQIASCAVVGVDDVRFLGFPDGLLEPTIELRRRLAHEIRRSKPEVVLSINFRDSWGGPSWNHADHRALGVALLDAVRDAANPWVFRSDEFEAWSGVRFVAFGGSPQPTHGVDVTESFDAGVRSLECHRLYLDNLQGGMADADSFLRAGATQAGELLGVPLASNFELVFV